MSSENTVSSVVDGLMFLELSDYQCDEAMRHINDSSEKEWKLSLTLPDIDTPMRNFFSVTVGKEAVLQLLNSHRELLKEKKSDSQKELSEL